MTRDLPLRGRKGKGGGKQGEEEEEKEEEEGGEERRRRSKEHLEGAATDKEGISREDWVLGALRRKPFKVDRAPDIPSKRGLGIDH